MSPEDINKNHGKPTWRCWHCRSETKLMWWRGLSIAVCCDDLECDKAIGAFFAEEIAKEEAYEAYCRENHPW